MKKKFQKTPLTMPLLPVNSSPSALRFRGVRPRRNTAGKFPAPRPAHHIQTNNRRNSKMQDYKKQAYQLELTDMLKYVKSDASIRSRLLKYFGNRTEYEIKLILDCKKNCYYKLQQLYCHNDEEKKIFKSKFTEYYQLLLGIQYYRKHSNLKAYDLAKIDKQKTAKKKIDMRKKTVKQKIIECYLEIKELREKNYTWEQVKTYLKRQHYSMYHTEKLNIYTLKKDYYEYSALQSADE